MLIFIGCSIMGLGFELFIMPYKIVPGGIYGAGIVLHTIFPSIQVGTFGYIFEIPLLIMASLIFGGGFGVRTIITALYTPAFMNGIEYFIYPNAEAMKALDPSQLLGGTLDLSNDLMMAVIMGSVLIGLGQGLVVRNQATTGGVDIIAMILQKFASIKFSTGILIADSVVVLSGLFVIGFGFGHNGVGSGWLLSLYSLIAIYIASRVVAYVLDGASYDKLIFIISDVRQEELKDFIINGLERSATYIKAKGMYTEVDKDMIFLVISRNQVHAVQHKIKEIDPKAFVVVTDAYNTYGEGFKAFPDAKDLAAE